MSAAHTPGPWEADGASDRGFRYHQIDTVIHPHTQDPSERYTVADTLSRDTEISAEEDAANAMLLAAAPELADALEAFLGPWKGPEGEWRRVQAGRDALRKAGRLP